MPVLRIRFFLGVALAATYVPAQTAPSLVPVQTTLVQPQVQPTPVVAPVTKTPAAPAAKSAQAETSDAPEILVPASDNSFAHTLSLQTAEPIVSEIRAGQLISTERPNLEIVPTVTAEAATKGIVGWTVPLKISGLLPFGTSTLPIFYQSKKVDTLHILKTGITVDTPANAILQGSTLLLVLRNPSSFHYTSVRARLRFGGRDICTFSTEHFPHPGNATGKTPAEASEPSRTTTADTKDVDECNEVAGWTEFQIPSYAGTSLRATALPADWFRAPDGYGRAVIQKGSLTLRFAGDDPNSQTLQEQVVPVEVSFQPGTISRSLGYLRVGSWLLLGALFSLLLRVAIPSYRRLRFIRDQLDEIRKNTRGISEEVDSMLRVQLRVENLSLGTLAGSVLVFSPGFAEVATRVETAMTTLRRRIDYVRRLDAALNRRHLLIADEMAQPTRVAAIDRSLNTASEELKSDQFREQDWVFIQQALEAADKILGNPTEEDKSTFETVLIQRWQSVSKQYGFTAEHGWDVPPSLAPMMMCFPKVETLCPKGTISTNPADLALAKQADAAQWIKAVGTVRADLQITALELVREFQFLAPAVMDDHWTKAMSTLIPWLATPAFENLNNARLLLRELSEGISPENIVTALQNGEAHIELDPQIVGSGERVHLAVRFWQMDWNSAAARQQIVCEWRFKAFEGKRQSGTPQAEPKPADSLASNSSSVDMIDEDDADPLFYREKGWEVYHYFEKAKGRSPLEVRFYLRGHLVMDARNPTQPLIYPYVFDLRTTSARKVFWEQSRRIVFESLELFAALLVPLCALAVSTADKGSSSQWWQLLGLGFGSDTIRNVLSGASDAKAQKPS